MRWHSSLIGRQCLTVIMFPLARGLVPTASFFKMLAYTPWFDYFDITIYSGRTLECHLNIMLPV